MKYICSVCGYIYDESKQKTPFDQLPASWVCPLCGAAARFWLSPRAAALRALRAPYARARSAVGLSPRGGGAALSFAERGVQRSSSSSRSLVETS